MNVCICPNTEVCYKGMFGGCNHGILHYRNNSCSYLCVPPGHMNGKRCIEVKMEEFIEEKEMTI